MAPTAPMTEVFLDTGFVVALSDRTDRHHQDAREHAVQISQEQVQWSRRRMSSLPIREQFCKELCRKKRTE
jgi:predicted nucleic acid-binding protein